MSGPPTAATAPRPALWMRMLGDLGRAPEDSRAFRAATLAAVMIAVAAVFANGAGGPLLWVGAAVMIPAGAVVSYLRRNDPSPVVPLVLTLLTVAATVGFIATHRNPVSPGELRVPLAELLVGLEGLRAFALRSRRELRFALASSLTLIAVAGALSVSITFAAFAAGWGAAALGALTLGYRSELVDLHVPVPVPRRRRARTAISGPIAVSLVAVAAIGTIAFLLVPAARSSRFLAFTARLPSQLAVPNPGQLSNPSLGAENPSAPGDSGGGGEPRQSFGYFGFSNRLDTSLRGRPDETLVLRVRASAPDFWRGQTFDVWNGRVWTLSDERTAVARGQAPIRLLDLPDEPPVGGTELIQTFYLETSGPNVIFAANRPIQVFIPQNALFQLSDGTVRTGVELERGAIYTVVSRRSLNTVAGLRAAGNTSETLTPPGLRARYTALPAIPDRVRALATRLTRDKATTYDKVVAIEEWMGANTRYSLDIPPLPPGEDAVERFLFEDRVGFCEQIGTSLVVMLRSQGIPARLAVGYTPGERNPFTGLYEVKAKDAHAWAEVYFPGLGWQGFDPTAQVPLAGEAPPDAARVGLRDYLSRHLPDLSAPLLAALIGVLLASLTVFVWRPLRRMWRRRQAQRRRSWADLQLARLEQIGSDLGRRRLPHETAGEYAAALRRTVVRDPRLDQIGEALAADAFAAEHLPPAERVRIQELIGSLTER